MEDKQRNILFSKEEIKEAVIKVGAQITKDYDGKSIYVLSLLRGSFIFTADLVREITVPTTIGFMTTSSYGNDEETTGVCKIVQDIPDTIKGMDVLIVDDIVDSGITMKFVVEHAKKLGARSVKCCTLLNKPERRKVEISPDYFCFEIPDLFVVGYGLNYGDLYRNIPYIFNWENK